MAETLKTLNNKYLCGSAENDAGQPLAKFNAKEFQDGVNIDLADSITSRQYGGFSILNQPQFAMFNYLNLIGQYYAGDFLPVTEDKKGQKDIKKIWNSLISKGYFGEVGISNDPILKAIERAKIEEQGDDGYRRDYFPESNIRLYVREKDSETGLSTFKSVGTNVGGLTANPSNMVQASCNGIFNFMGGGRILLDYMAGEEAYLNAFHASLKTLAVDVQDDTKFQAEKQQLMTSKETFFERNNAGIAGGGGVSNENEGEELTCFPIEGVLQVLKNNRALFDERAAFYGMFGKNLDQKKERNTVGENGVDFKYVNNVQRNYLMNLEVIIEEMKDKLGAPKDLKVVLNTNEPHEDERFKQTQGGKGGNKFGFGDDKQFQGGDGNDTFINNDR